MSLKTNLDFILEYLESDASIKEQARIELALEDFQSKVKAKKIQLMAKKTLRQKLFPFKIEVTKI